jgi:predicted O-methyltransferase YrrM
VTYCKLDASLQEDERVGPEFLKYVPGYRRLRNAVRLGSALRQHYGRYGSNPFLEFAPPGHFYSPLPDIDVVDRDRATLFDRRIESIPGIDNGVEGQLALLDTFSGYYDELPFKDDKRPGLRYYFRNPWFSYADAIVLYSMLRHRRPRRIIEVGSGFSSAVMLDTNDLFFARGIALTFIEPAPARLLSLLSEADRARHEIIVDGVQGVSLERFAALDAGDIVFVDSSHVAKIGSDVVHLLTNVLPALRPGVSVQFHDVFWPFEYPEEWIREGRAWNENYVLKAFLQFNTRFKIVFFNSYLATHHLDAMGHALPLSLMNTGGSLWIEKTS